MATGRPWFYQQGRPTRLGAFLNRLTAAVHSAGVLPSFLITLEVRGRRSGRVHPFPLVVGEYRGQQYLVSMLGEAAWVRNVRAAGGEAVIRCGRRRRVHLEEVPAAQRGPILHAYLQRALGARPHFPVPASAPPEAFDAIAAGYPVFRVLPPRRPG